MERYASFAIGFLCLWNLVSCKQQQLFCKTVDDSYTEPVRSPESVDYDKINQLVSEEVASAVAELNYRITELERKVTELQKRVGAEVNSINAELARSVTTEQSLGGTLQCTQEEGLYYRGKCYIVSHLSSSRYMNRDEAVSECAKTGALLAEIHDRPQQKALYDFAASKLSSKINFVRLWLGMEYDTSTSTLLYRSGTDNCTGPLLWLPGYPKPTNSYKYLSLIVRIDESAFFGLWNHGYHKSSERGVICEK